MWWKSRNEIIDEFGMTSDILMTKHEMIVGRFCETPRRLKSARQPFVIRHSAFSMTQTTGSRVNREPLVEEFLHYLANERNASPRTLKAYRHALTGFRAQNKTPWRTCTGDNFRDYLFTLMKHGQARSYVRLQFSALRTFYQFLAARKRFHRNPVQEVQLSKMEKKLTLVLTRQQVEELLTAPAREQKSRSAPSWMPLRDVAIMELFYSSGLRLSELAALDIADVDPYTESVRVFGKGRKERVPTR